MINKLFQKNLESAPFSTMLFDCVEVKSFLNNPDLKAKYRRSGMEHKAKVPIKQYFSSFL